MINIINIQGILSVGISRDLTMLGIGLTIIVMVIFALVNLFDNYNISDEVKAILAAILTVTIIINIIVMTYVHVSGSNIVYTVKYDDTLDMSIISENYEIISNDESNHVLILTNKRNANS